MSHSYFMQKYCRIYSVRIHSINELVVRAATFFPRVGLAITSHVSVKSILYDHAAFMVYCFIHGRSHRGGAGAAVPVPIGHNTFSLTFL